MVIGMPAGRQYDATVRLSNGQSFDIVMTVSRKYIAFYDSHHDTPRFCYHVRVPAHAPPGIQNLIRRLGPRRAKHVRGGRPQAIKILRAKKGG